MGINEKEKFSWKRRAYSFYYAFTGIKATFLKEWNFQFHSLSSVIVFGLGWMLGVSYVEWLILFLLMGGMLALELINSAIERIVDLVTEEFHPLAKQAKDAAAGAVLVYAIISFIIGVIIFMPKIFIL
ncbi:diacylglycerol kinase family protein [Bacillus carboniphilus]|uniref:Diacylglycerol kinase family protein n=1 Tax=Bacillus carboniphilus TaxID=86663 RepID=A0ABY9JY25_9BACI|nr:diacylglycerol kinase family protein [Bacillus carboniphilus]WLR44284.1 diacylglycerol kinase family protein [Bacillus carboniphilus]